MSRISPCSVSDLFVSIYGSASPDAHADVGGLAVIMQAFDISRQAASAAYSILQCILRPGSMSPKMMALNMALVARMDGVHRCCRLLCPVFSPQEVMEASLGEQSICCLTALCEAKVSLPMPISNECPTSCRLLFNVTVVAQAACN